MRLEIRGRKMDLSAAFRAHVDGRFRFALARFGGRIGRVAVRIEGPRGGGDATARCRVTVMMDPPRRIVVEASHPDPLVAADRAAERAGRAVGRETARPDTSAPKAARLPSS